LWLRIVVTILVELLPDYLVERSMSSHHHRLGKSIEDVTWSHLE
jgi:hypothetical protein